MPDRISVGILGEISEGIQEESGGIFLKENLKKKKSLDVHQVDPVEESLKKPREKSRRNA